VLRALDSGLVDAVQVVYNVFDQAPQDALFPYCQSHGIAVIARVPFDEGSLTGTLRQDSQWSEGDWRNLYFTPEHIRETLPHVERLQALVPDGQTLPEMALRFILHHPAVTTVVPGMRKPAHVAANLSVSDGRPFPADLLLRLRSHRWERDWVVP
jgi:aryl-alcohol dehydrogenase-like predicted oxidoreductase